MKQKTPKDQAPETDENEESRSAQDKSSRKRDRAASPGKPQKLSREEMKTLRKQRKDLHKELRKRGLKRRSDFELFANEAGLTYPEGTTSAFVSKTLLQTSGILRLIGASMNAKKLLLMAAAILAIVFLIAFITEEKGHFTINLTADMLREGFVLAEDEKFSDEKTRLFAEEITNSNATSIYEMSRKLHEIDGPHNGPGYMAYTFYLKNCGELMTNYGYTVNILSETLSTASAAWVMFFEDDRQIIYAQAQPNGHPEELYGYPSAPYIEYAFYPEDQYYTEDGFVGIVTTPFVDEDTVLQGYVEDFEPGAVKKYTIIVWLEGDDPDCNNSILGGHVGFNIQFERLGDDETGYFKGLFREEYDKTFNAENVGDSGHMTEDDYQAHTPEESPNGENAGSAHATNPE